MGGKGFARGRARWPVVLPLLLFFSAASPAFAQFWNKKSYRHWSASQCRKILTSSPWTKLDSFSATEMPNGAEGSLVPGRQPLMTITYRAQFFSALPVREADVRLAEIQAHYNRMSPAQKKSVNESAARYLARRFPQYTVIRVTYGTNVGAWQSELSMGWQLETTAKLRRSAYLVVDGKTIRLARFQLAPRNQQAFFLFFPRKVNHEPILSANHKSLTLQVTNSNIHFSNSFGNGSPVGQPPPAGNIQFEFNVKQMLFHGKVAY
jgi:hypothetical protein